MENEPKPESNNGGPEGVPFTEQLHLAKEMLAFADERNKFAQNMGGGDFEGFATVGQHVDDNRVKYDALNQEYEKFRADFDAAVPDKKAFVKKLRSMNENELADAVAMMFGVREGFFGKLFKK
jgi:hypothetical protein